MWCNGCDEDTNTLAPARIQFFSELICPPVDSFFTKKHMLTCKCNSLVLLKEQDLSASMICHGTSFFHKKYNRYKNNLRFGHSLISHLAGQFFLEPHWTWFLQQNVFCTSAHAQIYMPDHTPCLVFVGCNSLSNRNSLFSLDLKNYSTEPCDNHVS